MYSPQSLASWLAEGDFTLALSSSFFGFFSHCGFVTALREFGLRPSKVTGSSAGALVGGGLASGLEPDEMKEILFSLKRSDFWDPKPGFGFLRGKKFLRLLEKHFVSSFARAHLPLEVAVFDILSLKTRFINEGSLPKAIVASCAVPVMFHPVRIGKRFYFDGGLFHKSGINGTDKTERILSVFLQNDGLSGIYEWNTTFHRFTEKQKMLRYRKLPQVNPNNLETGKLAYSATYERTLRALEQPFAPRILEA